MEAQGDDEIFVYMGGDQEVPEHVRRTRIHKSVKIVRARAFQRRIYLISVDFHDGIEIIEEGAFHGCSLLSGSIKLLGIRIIKAEAFSNCHRLTDVEFGDKLETIEQRAFFNCYSLRNAIIPSVRSIGKMAFCCCDALTDLDLPEGLETVEEGAFCNCDRLRHISLPLKGDMIAVNVFVTCPNFTSVDLVGGIHRTVASLHLESWKNEMKGEITRINQVLPEAGAWTKTAVIQEWMRAVSRQINHYKAEHKKILKESTTLLELALWKAKIDENAEKESVEETKAKRLKPDTQGERRTQRITSGANIVFKNVLPFLELK